MTTYHVSYEWDGSHWLAFVDEIEGCHTFAKNSQTVQQHIRECIELWTEEQDFNIQGRWIQHIPEGSDESY